MKKLCNMFVLMMLASLMFGGLLWAQDRGRDGAVRGTFVRLVEQAEGEREVMGVVVKPFESDDHVTVLIPRENEDLRQAARRLQEGQNVAIAFVTEGGNNWVTRVEAGRPRDRAEERPQGERRMAVREEPRRDPGQSGERPEARGAQGLRSDQQRGRVRPREERDAGRPQTHLEQMEGQLREVVAGHAERMGRAIREVLAAHLGRMEAESRELRARVERMEKELAELRAENQRLSRQLRDRGEPTRERQREALERRGPDRQMERREPEERELPRDQDQGREPGPSRQ